MSKPRLTEERLRTWTISQDERERMCLGILALDPRFSKIEPRRPKGGPDGGRDIEAEFENGEIVWVGVGFRNNVTDSKEDKKWAKDKFKDDAHTAIAANPGLWGFVFFTNIDLTPTEQSELREYGLSVGLSFVEVFYRERLRITLDSPRGLALRYQYLDISLSPAEQKAFFAEYGSQIENLLHKGFGVIDEKLKRIEFLHDCLKPLMGGSVTLTLKQECTPEDLGHFRFMAQILNLHEPEPHPGLWIAGRDAYYVRYRQKKSQKLIGVKSLVWSQNPDKQIQNTIVGMAATATKQLNAAGHLHKCGPYYTLNDLDHKSMSIHVTEPLLNLISGIYVAINDYWIAGAPVEHFVPLKVPPLIDWPETLSQTEAEVPWIDIALKIQNPPAWMNPALARTGWGLDFSMYTPEKIT